ncbi:MAG: PEP-CTERM sorting domain-containing protein [Tepidisphaeraceae bacterium]
MSARTLLATAALAAGFGTFTSISFASIPWAQPNGSSPGNVFTYANGGSDAGLFGDPVVSDGGFTFFPSNFFAESSNGVAATKRDRMFVTINLPQNAPAGSRLLGIQVSELGDYSILGTGSVKVSGLLTATILGTTAANPGSIVGITYTDTMDADGNVFFGSDPNPVNDYGVTPAMPVSVTNGSVDGEWTATMMVSVPANFQATSLQIVMNNVLQATSGTNSTSFIEKKVLGSGTDPGVKIRIFQPDVPEPTTLTALGGVALLVLRRKR